MPCPCPEFCLSGLNATHQMLVFRVPRNMWTACLEIVVCGITLPIQLLAAPMEYVTVPSGILIVLGNFGEIEKEIGFMMRCEIIMKKVFILRTLL